MNHHAKYSQLINSAVKADRNRARRTAQRVNEACEFYGISAREVFEQGLVSFERPAKRIRIRKRTDRVLTGDVKLHVMPDVVTPSMKKRHAKQK